MTARRGKTVTKQTLIGDGGIALIHMRVNEMGLLYHDRRIDHGIDGEIEIVAPSGEALNLIVMVQSKASNRPRFTFENDESFQWTASEADLRYWLSGNAPVIVVVSRPAEGLAWWFDVRAEFGDPRRRAARTITINKRTQAFDKSAAIAIMRLGVPRDSGIYLPAPPKQEVLLSNLLPIVGWSDTIFVAPASVRTYRDAWARMRDTPGYGAGWILHDDNVISFGDLRNDPLRVLVDGDVEEHETAEWANSSDPDVTHRFADLLRRTLVGDRRELQWHQARHHLHFRPSRNLKPVKAGRAKGRPGRTVFGPHYAKADPDRVSYYHHAALTPRFRRLDDRWICQLGVDYCFTSDGKTESTFADGLLAGIKRLERHPAVMGWTRMWEQHLQPDLLTADSILAFGSLLTFNVDRGIDDAWWGPAPADAVDDDAANPSAEADLAIVLRSLDIDEADLLTLFDDPTDVDPPAEGAHPVRPAARKRSAPRPRKDGRR